MLPFLGLFLFLLVPSISRGKLHFIDVYLIFSLYFDAAIVLAGSQRVNFLYAQPMITLVYSIYYFSSRMGKMSVWDKKVLYPVLGFLFVILFYPIIKGADINQTVRSFSLNYSSLIMLPIAFHHYSTRGEIKNLFVVGGYFIILWTFIVMVYSFLRIDTLTRHGGTESFGLGLFYFGDMSRRGAISYMGLALLLLPAILPAFSKQRKLILITSSVIIGVIMLISMKRFSLIALTLGMANYIISAKVKILRKVSLAANVAILIIPVFLFTNLTSMIVSAYYSRGAEKKISIEAMQEDLRFYEPLYIINYTIEGGITGMLMGRDIDDKMDIETEKYTLVDRTIHNQYGVYMLLFGFTGLVLYLLIYLRLYHITRKFRRTLSIIKGINFQYWLVFQNIVIIFLLGGIGGGHTHITYRALVLIFAGGISGHYYKMLKERRNSSVPQSIVIPQSA